ncbi:MAG: hypothetical protein SGI91_12485 [Alphaproteobacteria bacterium]|jgi:hypothetical protein|nr:hypothetical protein [Alphaproteobacteria bacterium]
MRYQSFVFPAILVSMFAVACDNGGEDPGIPRTVPPTMKSTVTTIDAPAITAPNVTPAKPSVVQGTGPIYET